jgi:hypothetical protein
MKKLRCLLTAVAGWIATTTPAFAHATSVQDPATTTSKRSSAGTVAPDISVGGSTDGEAEAKVGMAFFFAARELWQTTVTINLGVQIEDGVGNIFSSSKEERAAVPNAWVLGISVGRIRLYDAEELIPAGSLPGDVGQPQAEIAYNMCLASCRPGLVAGGCKEFSDTIDTYKKADFDDNRGDWLRARWMPIAADNSDAIKSRVSYELPSSGSQCATAKTDLGASADALASAAGNKAEAWRALAGKVYGAALVCAQECRTPILGNELACRAVDAFVKDYGDHKTQVIDSDVVSEEELCEVGRDYMNKAQGSVAVLRRISVARYPRFVYNFGVKAGAGPHKFLEITENYQAEDMNGDPIGAPFTRLESVTKARETVTGGFTFAHVYVPTPREHENLTTAPYRGDGAGFTIEGMTLVSLSSKDSTTSARWCKSLDGVVGETNTAPMAESCKERPYGAPARSLGVTQELLLGWVETRLAFFRLAVGPRYSFSLAPTGSMHAHELTGRMPLTFSFTAVPRREGKLDFEGIVQVTPFAGFSSVTAPGDQGRTETTTSAIGGVVLELIGRRSLFATRFDHL